MDISKKKGIGKTWAVMGLLIMAALPIIIWVSDFLQGVPIPSWTN